MRAFLPVVMAAWISMVSPLAVAAPEAPHDDIAIGSLPAESVTAAVRKTLSPQGRFVILAATGIVRVFDTPQKIVEVRKVLEGMQNAPSIVSFALNFKIGMQQVTQQAPSSPVDYEIPIPGTYSAPRMVSQGGSTVVVPGQPGNFTTRHAGPGDRVYTGPGYAQGGYVTGTEVRVTRTGWQGGKDYAFVGTTAYPRPAAITVCAKVNDVQGLHDWAVNAGAVAANEPAWSDAATVIVVTPEHADGGLLLNLLPEIRAAGCEWTACTRNPA